MAERILTILKFVLALFLLPLVIATVVALQCQLDAITPQLHEAVTLGSLVYVLMNFFIYDFDAVYKFGQNIVSAGFQFLKPVMNFAPYVVPVYTILGIIGYAVGRTIPGVDAHAAYFLGFIAFTFTMHIVLTARDLYNKDSVIGKPDYFFAMGIVFVVDVFLIALLMGFVGNGFSFVQFFQKLSMVSVDIYTAAFKQFFVR